MPRILSGGRYDAKLGTTPSGKAVWLEKHPTEYKRWSPSDHLYAAILHEANRTRGGEVARLHRSLAQGAAKLTSHATKSDRAEKLMEDYGLWTSSYSNEDGDRIVGLANRLTAVDREEGRQAPAYGFSKERYAQAKKVVEDTNLYGAKQQALSARRRSSSHATKRAIPGVAKWHMSAGGTGAARDKHGYSLYVPEGEYHISPYTTKFGRHAGYLLKFAGTHGRPHGSHGGLWHDLGSHTSPQKAASAASQHYAKGFE